MREYHFTVTCFKKNICQKNLILEMIDSISALGPTQPAAEPRARSHPAPGDPSSVCPVQRPSAPSSCVQRPVRLHDHFQHRCSSQSKLLSASKTGRSERSEEGSIRGFVLGLLLVLKRKSLHFLSYFAFVWLRFVRIYYSDSSFAFVVVMRCSAYVEATGIVNLLGSYPLPPSQSDKPSSSQLSLAAAGGGHPTLHFTEQIQFSNLPVDFSIRVEVYALVCR